LEEKRKCGNCGKHIPPETTHFVINGDGYCTNCVEEKPYTAYLFYIDGEFVGSSEESDCIKVEDYDDFHEED
jgi:hypothetical protein